MRSLLIVCLLAFAAVPKAKAEGRAVFIAAEGDLPGLELALRGHLAEIGVAMDREEALPTAPLPAMAALARTIGATHKAKAVLWARGDAARASLYLWDVTSARLFERVIERPGGSDIAAVEALALVGRLAVEALGEGAVPRMQPVVIEKPPPAPVPVIAAPVHPGRSVGVAYDGGAWWDAGGFQSGGAVDGAVVFRALLVRASLWVHTPASVQLGGVSARLMSGGGSVAAGVRRTWGRATFTAEAGPFVNVWRRTTRHAPSDVEAAPASTRALWGATTRLGAEWSVIPSWSLFAHAGVDVIANAFALRATADAAETAGARRLSPRVRAGVRVDF